MDEYTFANICAGVIDGSIPIDESVIAQITRSAYYTPYENNVSNPYPIAYLNSLTSFISMDNSDTNGLNFLYTDFTTADDWIILNGSSS